MQVALLYGGRSSEHVVSVHSAQTIYGVLRKLGHKVYPIAITLEGHWYLQEDATPCELIKTDKEIVVRCGEGFFFQNTKLPIEVAFPVTHGHGGEDGQLQGLCSLARIPLCGCDTLSSSVMMFKAIAQQVFAQNDIPVVPTYVVDDTAEDYISLLAQAQKACGRSLFVKPEDGGSSIGVTALPSPDEEQLNEAITRARNYAQRVLIQSLIRPVSEIECALLEVPYEGLRVSEPGLVIDPANNQVLFLSYEHKYGKADADHMECPCSLPPADKQKIKDYAIRAFQAVKCNGYARVDFFYQQGRIWLNEVNTLPGMTENSHYPALIQSLGYSLEEVVSFLLKDALLSFQKESKRTYLPPCK
ncbi:MAG: D-alanine--D-alanine ligase [Sphaerochaetaceae bacterium]